MAGLDARPAGVSVAAWSASRIVRSAQNTAKQMIRAVKEDEKVKRRDADIALRSHAPPAAPLAGRAKKLAGAFLRGVTRHPPRMGGGAALLLALVCLAAAAVAETVVMPRVELLRCVTLIDALPLTCVSWQGGGGRNV